MTAPDLHLFAHHWQDEADAAFLYRLLSEAEPDAKKKDLYLRLALVEDRHVAIWADLLTRGGMPPRPFRPSGRARLLAFLGRTFGPKFLLPMLLAEEGREVKGYLAMHRTTPAGVAGKGDATAATQHTTVVLAGVAGIIADALSMGSSGYLAAKSEREVYEHEIEMEKAEVELMPEVERDELALIYETKGMDRASAHRLATEVMGDPKRMLDEQVQEELKIGEQQLSPLREGWVTGLATAVGALIPVLPFFFLTGLAAMITSFTLAMLSHFLVGAARSVFTGRGVIRSGMDMFVVGLGVAVIGYYAGEWVAQLVR